MRYKITFSFQQTVLSWIINKNTWTGIYIRPLEHLLFVTLPDYAPIFDAEMVAMILAPLIDVAAFSKFIALSSQSLRPQVF